MMRLARDARPGRAPGLTATVRIREDVSLSPQFDGFHRWLAGWLQIGALIASRPAG
jgi:hypothetical protein